MGVSFSAISAPIWSEDYSPSYLEAYCVPMTIEDYYRRNRNLGAASSPEAFGEFLRGQGDNKGPRNLEQRMLKIPLDPNEEEHGHKRNMESHRKALEEHRKLPSEADTIGLLCVDAWTDCDIITRRELKSGGKCEFEAELYVLADAEGYPGQISEYVYNSTAIVFDTDDIDDDKGGVVDADIDSDVGGGPGAFLVAKTKIKAKDLLKGPKVAIEPADVGAFIVVEDGPPFGSFIWADKVSFFFYPYGIGGRRDKRNLKERELCCTRGRKLEERELSQEERGLCRRKLEEHGGERNLCYIAGEIFVGIMGEVTPMFPTEVA